MRRSTGQTILFKTPSSGHQAPDVQRVRCKRRKEGVQDQGLADRHRYQARPCTDAQGILPAIVIGTEPSRGLGTRSTAPGGMEEPTACHRARSFGEQKPRPRNQHSPMPWGKRQEHPSSPRRVPVQPASQLSLGWPTRFVWLALRRHLCKRAFVCTRSLTLRNRIWF